MGKRETRATTPKEEGRLKVGKPKQVAAGFAGISKSFGIGMSEAGLRRTWGAMRTVNKFDGYDCPGCAWPDPDGHRSGFEFCENGAKAFATEATRMRVTPCFFAEHSVRSLSEQPDMWLDKQGRLTQPMVLRDGSDHYEPISWENAFEMISNAIKNLESANEAVLYTSGRTSNEAAFLWGTLARQIGTNNLPDCSNMCHESTGYALTPVIGIGKGTVRLSCFDKADLILVIGQNPGTNHPRMLSALASCKRNGGSIVSINPLEETGMRRFKHPQEVLSMIGSGTKIADDHFPVNINGDAALLKGLVKVILEEGQLDWDFIDTHTEGFEEFKQSAEAANWDDIVDGSGISRERITKLGMAVARSKCLIICWAMGLTQHRNSVSVIQEIANLLLMGGHFGRPGAGACPVRGHSNVQGDRTVGIQHNPKTEFLARLEDATGIGVPNEGGYDTVQAVKAMLNGEVCLFMGMGGNLVSAMSDTEQVANGMRNVDLTVQVSTKLNRSHLVTGREALILPCLGRTEIDQQPSGEQFVTVENSMGVVHMSRGSLVPASEHLLSEPAIVAGIGTACFGSEPFDWDGVLQDYDSIREVIEQVIPGFQGFNSRVREDGGFYLPNGPRDGPTWDTPSGKAQFTVHDLPNAVAESGQFTMMTVRSHDQYNTTIYGMDDRYRGVYGARRVVLMNPSDIAELGITPGDEVDLTSHFEGRSIHAPSWKVVAYEIPKGNLCTYFPEANVLVPLESVAEGSNTPTSKSVAVTVSLP